MKKLSLFPIIALLFAATMMITSSCNDEPETFDEGLLIGKWKSGTDHQVYELDYTGYTWDTADDVTEEEAQHFEWSLEVGTLVHIHLFEIKADGTRSVPKPYKVITLNDTELTYEDETIGKSYTYYRIEE